MSWQIVLNTSPLILLLKAELEFILPELFDSIYLPSGVYDEIMANPTDKATKRFLQRLEFQRCNCIANPLILN
jgi:hypothetical protein